MLTTVLLSKNIETLSFSSALVGNSISSDTTVFPAGMISVVFPPSKVTFCAVPPMIPPITIGSVLAILTEWIVTGIFPYSFEKNSRIILPLAVTVNSVLVVVPGFRTLNKLTSLFR